MEKNLPVSTYTISTNACGWHGVIEYFTMESVRDLITSKKYDVRSDIESRVPLPSWDRYPCPIFKRCKLIKCIGYVSIFVNTEKIRWLNLEICFFREKQKAFIRANCLHMLKLFELGIIDDTLLQKITF